MARQDLEVKKVAGTFCAKHPNGRPSKRFLTPFSLWYFTIYAPGSIVADNRPDWIAGVRARLYNYYSGTKVILASNEKWVVGSNGW